MPTYDYLCENCGNEFEQFQSITAKALRKCPKCGKMSLKRLIGCGSGIIFKGTGFYGTDYRSESYKAGAKKANSKPSAKKDETSAQTKDKPVANESKPAAKSEVKSS